MKFAKLFDIEDYQVLITVDYDIEKEREVVTIRTEINEIQLSMSVTLNPEKPGHEFLEGYTQEQAIEARKLLTQQLESL